MTARPPTNYTLFAVSRDHSPTHGLVWLATQHYLANNAYAASTVATCLGITTTAVHNITVDLLQHNYLQPEDFPETTVPTLPDLHLPDSDDPKVNALRHQLGISPKIVRALKAANIPSKHWHHEIYRVALLCADEEIKNPVAYAAAIILDQTRNPIYEPERTGRTPVEPG
jgi:hypothetical protein